jgi:hypothetical protein
MEVTEKAKKIAFTGPDTGWRKIDFRYGNNSLNGNRRLALP